MIYRKKFAWALIIFISLIVVTFNPSFAAEAPPGFYLVKSQNGVQLFRKDYPGGAPDFVQVINLSLGAAVKPLHGAIADPGVGQGVYGGNDAHFRSRSLSDYWRSFSTDNPSAFCITNGQFFYMLEYPTRLPFPLKVDGNLITDGYGIKDFPGKKLMLELWPEKADIVSLSKEALLSSSAPDIIAGLTEDAPKRIKFAVGRTFFGVADQNGDGVNETVLVFNSSISRQEDAANVLRSFGADKVMMLDGGGSTQLSCEGKSYIYSDRLIPQAIGIMAAPAGFSGRLEPTQLAPPPRVAVTNTEQLAAPSGSGADAVLEAPLLPLTTAEMDPKPTPESPHRASEQPTTAPTSQFVPDSTPTVIPDPEQTFSQPREQQGIDNPTPAPTLNPAPAVSLAPERQNALALINPGVERPAVDSQVAAVEVDSAVEQPIQIVDIVWVPLSMSPVLLLLLIMVHKIRGPHI